jgi:hypothetical protein
MATKTKTTTKATNHNPAVIVRTYSAGVHYGKLAAQSADGKRVTLTGARRIWSWKGANTLHEIALRGVGAGSRVSERVESIDLTEAIEILRCSPAGETAMEAASWPA